MRLLILSAAIAATVLGALPASAEVVIRAGEGGVAVGERHHDEGWRRSHAECRTVRERIETPSGRIVVKTRRTC
jgi:hypothetical protein